MQWAPHESFLVQAVHKRQSIACSKKHIEQAMHRAPPRLHIESLRFCQHGAELPLRKCRGLQQKRGAASGRTRVDRRRWIDVTSAVHMPRALTVVCSNGFGVEPWPIDDVLPENWWDRPAGSVQDRSSGTGTHGAPWVNANAHILLCLWVTNGRTDCSSSHVGFKALIMEALCT